MGKHSHKDPNATGRQNQPSVGKHSTVEGYRVGNQDPSKRGLGNAAGNENNR